MLEYLTAKIGGRVSVERVVSGSGIPNVSIIELLQSYGAEIEICIILYGDRIDVLSAVNTIDSLFPAQL
jgi:hypothetical protein